MPVTGALWDKMDLVKPRPLELRRFPLGLSEEDLIAQEVEDASAATPEERIDALV